MNQANPEYEAALEQNLLLKAELDGLVNGPSDYGNSENVVKLASYGNSQGDALKIR
jgi:hypothetical protein